MNANPIPSTVDSNKIDNNNNLRGRENGTIVIGSTNVSNNSNNTMRESASNMFLWTGKESERGTENGNDNHPHNSNNSARGNDNNTQRGRFTRGKGSNMSGRGNVLSS
jgi:hypothetical protein